ncbi:MAG: sigma 54-interacting transcriptional regulator [Archangiaceae bacterium]|nr:sigma 54-interacting transcriptional regulator [Archangiaceae bacterium]
MVANLVLEWALGGKAHRVALKDRGVIGSAPEAAVVIDDPHVSRMHAELEFRDGGWWVRDLGSRNGTFVQGLRVGEAKLPDPARLNLGPVAVSCIAEAPQSRELWPSAQFGPLRGKSVPMRQLFGDLMRCAEVEATVLVRGETGTGKELVARAVHESSARSGGPFVIVDCTSLTDTLFESELFGHAKGAFTGALKARAGAFEEAEGGTLFLDEVGELPLEHQAKLLRVIEARTVRRVGESQHRPINVRIVSATHRDLASQVTAGHFREDLYFRLAVLTLWVPPLRQRLEDIPLLVNAFLESRGASQQLPPDVLEALVSRSWPGNVRELRNVIERVLALGPGRGLAQSDGPQPAGASSDRANLPLREAREAALEAFERDYVRTVLARFGGDVAAASKAAGIDRTYLYRLMRKLGLS